MFFNTEHQCGTQERVFTEMGNSWTTDERNWEEVGRERPAKTNLQVWIRVVIDHDRHLVDWFPKRNTNISHGCSTLIADRIWWRASTYVFHSLFPSFFGLHNYHYDTVMISGKMSHALIHMLLKEVDKKIQKIAFILHKAVNYQKKRWSMVHNEWNSSETSMNCVTTMGDGQEALIIRKIQCSLILPISA